MPRAQTASVTTGFTADIDAGIGFDAITVALLGRSRPWGVFAAGAVISALLVPNGKLPVTEGDEAPAMAH